MKKIVCLLMALALCLSVTAMAEEATPSKTIQDLNKFEVTMENPIPEGAAPVQMAPLATNELTEEQKAAFEETLTVCNDEVAKLQNAAAPVEYFTSVKDETGKVVTIADLLGTDKVDVFEFCPAVATGYDEAYGKVTASMKFATPYTENDKLVVMVGIFENDAINWTAYPATVVDGNVQFTMNPESALAMQNGVALIAVVSVSTEAAE